MTDALRELLGIAGIQPAGMPSIAGDDPVLPTPYRIGTAATAALAALGAAVARFGELRGLPRQNVSVDLPHAALSLRSARYLRIDGKPLPPVWDPLSGFYPVRDGWISIHCNFPNHRDAAMKVLQSPPDRKEAERKSATWDGQALEDAIHAAAGCAGFVRTAEDWQRHPQAKAVAEQPLIEIQRIGDAPAKKPGAAKRPLAGIRALDLTRVLAGPTCGKCLAEHGADLLKISAEHLPDSGLVEMDTGIGKRSARLDLRTQSEKLEQLVKGADVFCQSYRPGALAARGFSPERLAELKPGIVCTSLSAWGTTGPWRTRRGFDSIVQAVSGMAHKSGDSKGPKLLPVSAIDYISGYLMAFGTVLALERRAREGGSWLVRVALARVGRWIVDRGLVTFDGVPADVPAAELARYCAEMDAPVGRLTYLKPVIQFSHTPGAWTQPPVPLGTHEARWEQ
ncbi:MAG TPA: CoA transferase [Burkholderiales bacterium]|nr:CoA transferase [Burkholderiales bacterium]